MHHEILPIPCKPWTLSWLSEQLIVSHYENNYGGAVRALNAIRDRLATRDLATTPPEEIRALKREELAAVNSVFLHELYFANLGGDGRVPAPLAAALALHFGSVDRWRREFAAAAHSLAGGSGWVVLSYSPRDGSLNTQIALDHSQATPGAVPLLVLDMYEHAYQRDFGANAAAYVDAFMRLVAWPVVCERLMEARGAVPYREPSPGDETLPSISVEELRALMAKEESLQVLDARPKHYVSKSPDTMPSAVWRDPEQVDEWCGDLKPDAPVVVYCAYGFHVGCSVTSVLRERGLDARYVRGGLSAWYGAGGARSVAAG